jgi:hypothetical protein
MARGWRQNHGGTESSAEVCEENAGLKSELSGTDGQSFLNAPAERSPAFAGDLFTGIIELTCRRWNLASISAWALKPQHALS